MLEVPCRRRDGRALAGRWREALRRSCLAARGRCRWALRGRCLTAGRGVRAPPAAAAAYNISLVVDERLGGVRSCSDPYSGGSAEGCGRRAAETKRLLRSVPAPAVRPWRLCCRLFARILGMALDESPPHERRGNPTATPVGLAGRTGVRLSQTRNVNLRRFGVHFWWFRMVVSIFRRPTEGSLCCGGTVVTTLRPWDLGFPLSAELVCSWLLGQLCCCVVMNVLRRRWRRTRTSVWLLAA